VPAGKAIALAAMPTAVLMGMGFTPTLALADDHPSSASLSADEYKDCVTALESASASPSESASDDASGSATPSPSASASTGGDASKDTSSATDGKSSDSGSSSGKDTGSGAAAPTPSATASADSAKDTASTGATATPSATASPSATTGGNLLENVGDAITDLLTGGGSTATESATPTPAASASASASADKSAESSSDKDTSAAKDTTDAVTKAAGDAVKDTTDAATKAADDATTASPDATESATPTPSASASAGTDPADCPAATDDDGSGIDNKVTLPDDPWYLNASSLTLTGADYQGVVKVKTANGTVKKVLKYVISDGTDIGDLDQTVLDKQAGKTYHVEGAAGSTSTIRDGQTTMYTESISGNLFGLIPVTFDVDNPPPLNIPLIYFTKVTVVQAGQFGGNLHIPGLNQYITDGTG
jgi:hypothetical protein